MLLALRARGWDASRSSYGLAHARRTGRAAEPRSPGHRQPRTGRRLLGPRAKLLSRDALLEIARAVLAGEQAGIEHALADYELAVQRRLDHTRILVRAGPALGLMGTLIPLAPGLAALGRGEVSTLADDLRTAFAATTIGLLVGTVAFALTLTRTRIYSEDLTALERATIPIAAPPAHTGTGPTRPIATPQMPPTKHARSADPAGDPMNRRTGLGRHGRIEDAAGDPLDGLVNLFDIGIVLAVAFLIAGLGLTLNRHTHRLQARTPTTQHTPTLPSPSASAPAAAAAASRSALSIASATDSSSTCKGSDEAHA